VKTSQNHTKSGWKPDESMVFDKRALIYTMISENASLWKEKKRLFFWTKGFVLNTFGESKEVKKCGGVQMVWQG
jgi:hypothetical protein